MSNMNVHDKDNDPKFVEKCINTVRVLAVDMVQQAQSGHPGMPLGMAPIGYTLWTRVMRYNPKNSHWLNRDRFVMSNGHGCALQYALLHLTGYQLTLEDLKAFRQVGSKTPGHPERYHTDGIEVTTGPLGQGIANAVGLAIAGKHLAARFNRDQMKIVDNFIYATLGDGCMMEGISSEACSLAGHLGLGNLIAFYDNNKISIDGDTHITFTEDVGKRYEAYDWHVQVVEDGHLPSAVEPLLKAIKIAKNVTNKPSLIIVNTIIGFGSKQQGTAEVHGSALKPDDVKQLKTKFGFDPEKTFDIPEDVKKYYDKFVLVGQKLEEEWNAQLSEYEKGYPDAAKELKAILQNKLLPDNWRSFLPKFDEKSKDDATRNSSGVVLNALAAQIPAIVGGSADLVSSCKTGLKHSKAMTKGNYSGQEIHFGVREHAMVAINNGIAAYGGFIPFGSSFLNFIEYCFPSVRLAALSKLRQLLIFTHDSIGLGEDGPTHQPIEALALCRATPNLLLLRPADGREVVGAYIAALDHDLGPTVLALSRQNLPTLKNSSVEKVSKGAYEVERFSANNKSTSQLDLILIGTGSEVSVVLEAGKILSEAHDLHVRIVSFPSAELFDQQPVDYRREVLPVGVPVISVEAAATFGWNRYAHYTIGINTFGQSGAWKDVYKYFGFTGENVSKTVIKYLEKIPKIGTKQQAPTLPVHYADEPVSARL